MVEHPDDETAYAALAAAVDDARWAFGTGFTDPLAGVDSAVPEGTDRAALAAYCTMLGDDALIASHRLQEWVTRLPELEEEAAVANIALDLLGQARRLFARAGQVEGAGRTEDDLAYFREPQEFRCVRLVEPPMTDFADLVVRVLVLATWRRALLHAVTGGRDEVLAAIARQAVKEIDYHREWSAAWLERLGDGTELSHARAQAALEAAWPYLPELFDTHPVETELAGIAVPAAMVAEPVLADLADAVGRSTLSVPEARRLGPVGGSAGRDGGHTDHLSLALAELQSVARAHPGAAW